MKVITIVGTSLFDNNDIDLTNYDFVGQSFSEWENYEYEIEELKEEINKVDSAEITVAKKLKEKYEDLEIILFTSDTIESVLAGEIIAEYLKNQSIDVVFEKDYDKNVVKDLQIDISKIEIGVNNLISKIIELHKNGNKYDFNETIFNITGGYKPLITYLSILAQITNSKIVYAFKDTKEILDIPQLPISFDDKIADLYLPYLNNFILENIQNSEIVNQLEQMHLIKNKKLTELGRFFKIYMNYKNSYFGDLIEYLLYSYFSHKPTLKNCTIEQGKPYYINNQSGDFDLYIECDNFIEIKEIKSLGQVAKFLKKQVEKYKHWLEQNSNNKQKKITLLVYLVEKEILENLFKDQFVNLQKELEKNNIEFSVEYLELPLKNMNSFIKEFRNLKIKTLNLKG